MQFKSAVMVKMTIGRKPVRYVKRNYTIQENRVKRVLTVAKPWFYDRQPSNTQPFCPSIISDRITLSGVKN
jgi:hypothetical protein